MMQDFFEKYQDRIAPEPNTGCWIWFGSATSKGYGNGTRNYTSFYAHRAAYEATHGDGSASGLEVMHECDFPPCCNPDHLKLGTHMQNMRDAFARGLVKSARGRAVGTAMLTEAKVRRIRQLHASGMHVAAIRRKLKLTKLKWDTVSKAAAGITWAHVDAG